jgi:hypothetical protein
MTPAGPEMKMEEDFLHLVALGPAACELQTTTRHELNVCSLRGCCGQWAFKSTCGEASMYRVTSDGVASHRFMVSQLARIARNEKGFVVLSSCKATS